MEMASSRACEDGTNGDVEHTWSRTAGSAGRGEPGVTGRVQPAGAGATPRSRPRPDRGHAQTATTAVENFNLQVPGSPPIVLPTSLHLVPCPPLDPEIRQKVLRQ